MNYELRKILSPIAGIIVTEVVSYPVMARRQSHVDPLDNAKRKVADVAAHKIAGHILRNSEWQQTALPEGLELRIRGYWLSYDKLFSLLEEAYTLGRTVPVAVSVVHETTNKLTEQETASARRN